MSHQIWVVMTDGRYIRMLYNKGEGAALSTLKADDNQALADLSFEVVRGMKPGATNGTASKQKTDMQLLADFLSSQLGESQYEKLILLAPRAAIDKLKAELTDEVKALIKGTHDADMLAASMDEIEAAIGDKVMAAQS